MSYSKPFSLTRLSRRYRCTQCGRDHVQTPICSKCQRQNVKVEEHHLFTVLRIMMKGDYHGK